MHDFLQVKLSFCPLKKLDLRGFCKLYEGNKFTYLPDPPILVALMMTRLATEEMVTFGFLRINGLVFFVGPFNVSCN